MISIPKIESDGSNQRTVAKFYDRWIGGFGPYGAVGRLIFSVSGDIYARPFIRAAEVTSSDRILELGCGPGMNLIKTHQLTSSSRNYLGFDISSEMIERARENVGFAGLGQKIFTMIGGVNLPVASASVDVILLSHLIKYLTDELLAVCFAECRRALTDKGRLALWEFAPTDVPFVTNLIARGAGAVVIRPKERIEAMLSASGFNSFDHFDIVTPWTFWSNLAIVARP
jgi:ubiquinone/menaquinone biosynthesis C-methylase UbiE